MTTTTITPEMWARKAIMSVTDLEHATDMHEAKFHALMTAVGEYMLANDLPYVAVFHRMDSPEQIYQPQQQFSGNSNMYQNLFGNPNRQGYDTHMPFGQPNMQFGTVPPMAMGGGFNPNQNMYQQSPNGPYGNNPSTREQIIRVGDSRHIGERGLSELINKTPVHCTHEGVDYYLLQSGKLSVTKTGNDKFLITLAPHSTRLPWTVTNGSKEYVGDEVIAIINSDPSQQVSSGVGYNVYVNNIGATLVVKDLYNGRYATTVFHPTEVKPAKVGYETVIFNLIDSGSVSRYLSEGYTTTENGNMVVCYTDRTVVLSSKSVGRNSCIAHYPGKDDAVIKTIDENMGEVFDKLISDRGTYKEKPE